jgi:hypothetical protein
MSAGDFLFISGATGINAVAINGGYDRTAEMRGFYELYSKRGDASLCMEHFGGKWQVKPVSYKGLDRCCAWVRGGCAAEACTSRKWHVVDDGKGFRDAPSVKMVAGAEAQHQVGLHCIRALQYPCPSLPLPLPLPHLLRRALDSPDLLCFLRRLLLKQRPFQMTTRAQLPCSSAALQVSMLLSSTVFSNRRRRRGRMDV